MKCLRLILFGSLFLLTHYSQAQKRETPKGNPSDKGEIESSPGDTTSQGPDWKALKKKLVIGGGLGLSFFTNDKINYTLFQISPQVGYKVKENLIAGCGVQLFSISSRHSSYWEYGPDFFLRAHIIQTFFVQAQFEYLNFEDYLLPGKRVWNPGMLLGLGYGTYGYSFGLYTDVIQNRFSEQLYPGNLYIAGRPFFLKGQLLFNLDN